VVSGDTCDEVVAALALIAAVLVDPNAATDGTEATRTDAASESRITPSKVVAPEQTVLPERQPVTQASVRSAPWEFGGGVGFGLQGAIAPDPALALSAELAAELRNPHVFSPLFSLAAHYAASDVVETGNENGDEATFKWLAARVSACPVRWPGEAVALRPCAFLDLGKLTGTPGQQTVDGQPQSVVWWAGGLFGRFDAAPLDNLRLFVDVGLIVPFKRDRFFFRTEPETTAHQVPHWGPLARAGLMTWFP
jgi:hypothetical protein